jgi:hypothetical protein
VPYVTVIQTGTTVTFPNRDPILHHVYSFSPAKPFEIKLYTGKSPVEVVFDKPGVVTLGCNIHDWMIGYIAVVPTPWFAKTDAAGTAIIRDLPPGAYDIQAWHPHQRGTIGPARGDVRCRFFHAHGRLHHRRAAAQAQVQAAARPTQVLMTETIPPPPPPPPPPPRSAPGSRFRASARGLVIFFVALLVLVQGLGASS